MPTTVLSRQRSWIAILTVLAMVASFMAIATPVQAELQKTSATCPSTIPSAGFTDLGGLEDRNGASHQLSGVLWHHVRDYHHSVFTEQPGATLADGVVVDPDGDRHGCGAGRRNGSGLY